MTYRVALVGTHSQSREHAQSWRRIPGVEVVGVLTSRPETLQGIAPAFTDWDALLAQARPDVIDVNSLEPDHHRYLLRAAAAGKALFVCAPLGRTLADCDSAAQAVERASVPFMAAHPLRWSPEYAAARRLVESGAIGRPAAIRTARLTGPSGEAGGVVTELGLYDFDWLRGTFGPISRVFACGLPRRLSSADGREYALVTLRFASGALAHVTGSRGHPGGFRTTLEVAGDAGLIEHDSARSAPLLSSRHDAGVVEAASPPSPLAPPDEPDFRARCAFVEALQAGGAPPDGVRDAYEATRIALAAQESVETGTVVTLS